VETGPRCNREVGCLVVCHTGGGHDQQKEPHSIEEEFDHRRSRVLAYYLFRNVSDCETCNDAEKHVE